MKKVLGLRGKIRFYIGMSPGFYKTGSGSNKPRGGLGKKWEDERAPQPKPESTMIPDKNRIILSHNKEGGTL